MRRSVQAKQWRYAGLHILDSVFRRFSGELDTTGVTIYALDLVGQHGAGNRQTVRQDDFERVPFDRARYRPDKEVR